MVEREGDKLAPIQRFEDIDEEITPLDQIQDQEVQRSLDDSIEFSKPWSPVYKSSSPKIFPPLTVEETQAI